MERCAPRVPEALSSCTPRRRLDTEKKHQVLRSCEDPAGQSERSCLGHTTGSGDWNDFRRVT